MSVNVAWERTDGVLTAKVSGRVDSNNSADLQQLVDAEIGSEDSALLLDFEHLAFISSAGLRVALAAARRCRAEGKKFGICSLSESISEIMNVSGFVQIIAVYDSHSSALSAMIDS